jgi:hypothetical protein
MSSGLKIHWPELVGLPAQESINRILSDRPDLVSVLSIPQGSMVTCDYREDRVRVYIDSNGIVVRAPTIG